MKTNVATYYTILKNGEQEKVNEKAYLKLVETAKQAGEEPPAPIKVQSFGFPEAENDADVALLASTEEVRVGLFNRAASLKMIQGGGGVDDLMVDNEDFTPVEGIYDLTSVINAPTERRAASPEAKIEKLLSGLDEATMQRIMQKIMDKQTAPASV